MPQLYRLASITAIQQSTQPEQVSKRLSIVLQVLKQRQIKTDHSSRKGEGTSAIFKLATETLESGPCGVAGACVVEIRLSTLFAN
jgi:hypothetical protein